MRKPTPFILALAAAALVASWAGPAAAYIGPGAGITMLGALWGVIVAIALALAAVLFWPIRILLRKRRKPAGAVAADSAVARDKAS
jgi:Na+/melibiose symporter-like transporter